MVMKKVKKKVRKSEEKKAPKVSFSSRKTMLAVNRTKAPKCWLATLRHDLKFSVRKLQKKSRNPNSGD